MYGIIAVLAVIMLSVQNLPEDYVLYVAAYENGRFSQMKQVVLDEYGMRTYFEVTGEDSFKVFLWDSLDTLKPLCDAVSTTYREI